MAWQKAVAQGRGDAFPDLAVALRAWIEEAAMCRKISTRLSFKATRQRFAKGNRRKLVHPIRAEGRQGHGPYLPIVGQHVLLGDAVAEEYMLPYNRKIWSISL